MSVSSVESRSFILTLFIRDDGERFLLGDKGYEFSESQLHFNANIVENDEVEKQGTDGTMLAGQVRRSSVQTFDGYIGDGSTPTDVVEQMRRDFFAFFAKDHFYRAIYIDCNRNAWQRKGGYIVDAPEVKELYQITPEYHVGLNFEDVNYYTYDENEEGEEILGDLIQVEVSHEVSGGLVWDENGAVIEDAEFDSSVKESTGSEIAINDAVASPFNNVELLGNTEQNGTPTPDYPQAVKTTTGRQVVEVRGKNLTNRSQTVSLKAGSEKWAAIALDDVNWVQGQTYYVRIFLDYQSNELAQIPNYGYMRVDNAQGMIVYNGTTPRLRVGQNTLNSNLVNEQVNIMVSTEAITDFEPYQGYSHEINLGKNLFNGSIVEDKVINSSGVETALADFCITNAISVEPNTTYTASAKSNGDTSKDHYCRVAYYDSNMTFISRPSVLFPYTFTTPSNARFVKLSYEFKANTEVQLELGQATTYAPYFNPIELCKLGTYQDYIYKDNGKWFVHKEVGKKTFDGTESWFQSGATTASAEVVALDPLPSKGISIPYTGREVSVSDRFTYSSQNTKIGAFALYNQSGTMVSSLSLCFDKTKIADLASAKTWLGTNKPSIYYALATPTDTEITYEPLIEQLNNLQWGGTLKGSNNIVITSANGNATGSLQVIYYTKHDLIGGGYVWEQGGGGGSTIAINNSITSVSPIWTVKGTVLNPLLENTTTGEYIQYVGLVAEGQTLVVDMGEQTALLDGINVLSNIVGDFITLKAGANTLLYSVEGDAEPSELGWSEIVG